MAAPQQPVSPGHFDRFNFCNSAPGFELKIDLVSLGGNPQPMSPITIGPKSIEHVDVCGPSDADTFHIEGRVSPQGGQDVSFVVDYGPVGGSFLNNVVFGLLERCGGSAEPVLFGEAELTVDDNENPVTSWDALQGLPPVDVD